MGNTHPLHPSELHLLGRAASQVLVFFGRHELEPSMHLDLVPAQGTCLRVWFRFEPSPAILAMWWKQPWLQYFEVDEVSAHPPAYSFTLTVHTLSPAPTP